MPYGSSEEERMRGIKQLKSVTVEGKQQRKLLKERVDNMQHETHALGVEMGQHYISTAVYSSDEKENFRPKGREVEDSTRYYEPGTYPGRRMPHA